MDKNEIISLLESKGIGFSIVGHKAVYTIGEMLEAGIAEPGLVAKNLLLTDKRDYFLLSVYGERRVNLKEFKKIYHTGSLSFASEDDLLRLLSLSKGAVTPFGLLCDEERKVRFFIDRFFEDKFIGIHPMVNTATVFLKSSDLASLILAHGNSVTWMD